MRHFHTEFLHSSQINSLTPPGERAWLLPLPIWTLWLAGLAWSHHDRKMKRSTPHNTNTTTLPKVWRGVWAKHKFNFVYLKVHPQQTYICSYIVLSGTRIFDFFKYALEQICDRYDRILFARIFDSIFNFWGYPTPLLLNLGQICCSPHLHLILPWLHYWRPHLSRTYFICVLSHSTALPCPFSSSLSLHEPSCHRSCKYFRHHCHRRLQCRSSLGSRPFLAVSTWISAVETASLKFPFFQSWFTTLISSSVSPLAFSPDLTPSNWDIPIPT